MHRLKRHENEHAPCNAWCTNGQHVDMVYLHPWLVDEAGDNLLGVLQRQWERKGYSQESELVALKPAPESASLFQYYPRSSLRRPANTLAYRVTYRIHREQEHG